MKVIRIYDDREILYNNIDWIRLCSAEVLIEYCTFQDRKHLRIVVDESNNKTVVKNWDFNPANEYYVFLDTRWDSGLVDKLEWISGKMEMPLGLISQLGQSCVSKVVVYTTYDPDEGEKLLETLRGKDDLVNKLVNKLLMFSFFQPDKIIYDISQEVK